MKISKETLNVFKAFSAINANLLIKPGSDLMTKSPQKTIFSTITVEEDFPKEFGIYDLSEWLAVISLFESPDVEFHDKYAVISEGSSSLTYYAADSSILVVPDKPIKFPADAEIDFVLPAATLDMALKTAGVLKSGDISIVGDGKEIALAVSDLKNATANSFKKVIDSSNIEFRANLKVANLKLIPGDYEVSISSKKIIRFKHTTMKAVFFVALESSSNF